MGDLGLETFAKVRALHDRTDSPGEKAAAAGIQAARQAAMVAAVSIEIRDDAREVRQQAAAAALHGLAEGLRVAFLDPPAEPDPTCAAMARIAADPAQSGEIPAVVKTFSRCYILEDAPVRCGIPTVLSASNLEVDR